MTAPLKSLRGSPSPHAGDGPRGLRRLDPGFGPACRRSLNGRARARRSMRGRLAVPANRSAGCNLSQETPNWGSRCRGCRRRFRCHAFLA